MEQNQPEPIDENLAALVVEAVEDELFDAVATDQDAGYVESLRDLREKAITGRPERAEG